MLDDIKVSVVIPFYNRIAWTIESIRSVQVQTHELFEILLVDDGSTDDLKELNELILLDSRIRYVRLENVGPSKARNVAIAAATGAYIAFLDSDDLFYPSKLELQLKYMETNSLAISHTSYEQMDATGRIISQVNSGKFSGAVFPRIIETCPIATPTVMVRTRVLRLHQFLENLTLGEDVCLWIKITSEFELGGLDLPLSRVRILSTTASVNPMKMTKGLLNIASYVAGDPVFSLYGKHLRRLLLSTMATVSRSDGLLSDYTLVPESKPLLVKRAVLFYRKNGFRQTITQTLFVIFSFIESTAAKIRIRL